MRFFTIAAVASVSQAVTLSAMEQEESWWNVAKAIATSPITHQIAGAAIKHLTGGEDISNQAYIQATEDSWWSMAKAIASSPITHQIAGAAIKHLTGGEEITENQLAEIMN